MIFLIFLCIYGTFHLYFFIKVKNTFPALTLGGLLLLSLFLGLMMTGPFLLRLMEYGLPDGYTRFFAHLIYFWMGFIFLFFILSLLVDIIICFNFLIEHITHYRHSLWRPPRAVCFYVPVCLALLICFYGIYEAAHPQIRHWIIETEKAPPQEKPFRVVQITDVHFGIAMTNKQARRIVAAVRETQPDLLVCTGDILDGRPRSLFPQ
ncbi:MAG: metallophosphoesterase, partial [Syntrophobacterales bacterium]|nr:metallophosphoesterase [Syntrophobacterales bacterium]